MRRLLTSLALSGAFALPAAAQAADTIRIGLSLSQTGNLADAAAHYWRGVELWRDEINARGGLLGKKVEFVSYDDRSDPATAARLYERLITSDNVDLLIAPAGSGATAAASAVAEKHKRIMINGGGTAEAIHLRGFKYIFQTAARTSAYAVGVDPLMSKYGVKTMVFVARDYGAARDMEKILKAQAEKNGVKIVLSDYFPSGNVDFSSHIARARELKPDLWVSVGYPSEAIEMVRQFRASNYFPKIFIHNGVSQEDFLKSIGKDGELAIGISLYEPSLKTAGNAKFVKDYKARYNYEPGYYSAFSFVSVTVLEAAVKKTGSLDQEALRKTLTEFKTDTIMGRHEVDPVTGMQIGINGLLVQVLGGKREIFWPEALRTAEPRIPAPGWDSR